MLTLTPQARAVATFTLAVLLTMGVLDRLGFSVVQVLSPHGTMSQKTATVVVAAISLAIGAALVGIASQSVARLETGWPHALAQAAVLLAIIGSGIAALDLLAALLGDGTRAGFYGMVG